MSLGFIPVGLEPWGAHGNLLTPAAEVYLRLEHIGVSRVKYVFKGRFDVQLGVTVGTGISTKYLSTTTEDLGPGANLSLLGKIFNVNED